MENNYLRRIVTFCILFVSTIFSIFATEYTVPDKECMSRSEENPCEIFKCMEFPIDQFSFGNGPVLKPISHSDKSCGCK